MDTKVAYQNKDIISKFFGNRMKGKPLSLFGLETDLKVVDTRPTNIPVVEAKELRIDSLFELEDGSVAILDYESTFKESNFTAIQQCVDLARELQDMGQKNFALAGILTFMDKIIDEKMKKYIEEVLRMTEVGNRLLEQGRQEGLLEGREEGKKEGRKEGREESSKKIAFKMYEKNYPLEYIAELVEFPISTIQKWLAEPRTDI